MQLIIQINLYCLIPDSHKKTKTNNNRIAMKKFQRFCTLFLLMIGLCSFALHAQSYAATSQLKDSLQIAQSSGRRLQLFIRPNTKLSGPLKNAITQHNISVRYLW